MDTEALVGMLVGIVGLVICGVAVHWTARASAKPGALPRNHTIGIRTRATQASDEAWEAGHEASIPMMLRSAQAAYVAAGFTAFTVVALALGDMSVQWAFVPLIGGFVVQIAYALLATRDANRAARAVTDDG
ncbi:hypothetical protein BJF85_06185 [Saccharomonospora sp. CUA-673]|uniref:SdpI family protein n=1 Tax=Saccharomonospora sp. CUA-673 TaxID=1904969 RepID=UPI00095FFE8E|nr:SdpI family protein [Saccharomonospora sp. CUA-673]OLT39952.1 hypothetical protein BJF85_06185 [Saccharomonospora sp. CUA-673]